MNTKAAVTQAEETVREMHPIVEQLSNLPATLTPLREEVLANLAMLAQIPAPTGEEQERVRYILDRFVAAGMPEAGADEKGNAVGFLPGKTGRRTIMLVAHLDTTIPKEVDHNVVVQADRVVGAGVSDNSLGVAVMSMIPRCLDELGIQLDSNLKLLGSIGSLQRGDHEGLRFFLDHTQRTIDFGLVLEGIQLGRLNTFSIGTVRGDIICDVRPENERGYGSGSALIVLNQIINRILKISTPTRPFTKIRLGQMRAGALYNIEPVHGELGFEVVSDSNEMIDRIVGEIATIVREMSARNAIDAKLECFFRREPGGIPFAHPLVKTAVDVMGQLEISPNQEHQASELSEFVAKGIPALTLGITTGETYVRRPDYVMIEPILKGVSQIIGVLLEIDRGACDEQ